MNINGLNKIWVIEDDQDHYELLSYYLENQQEDLNIRNLFFEDDVLDALANTTDQDLPDMLIMDLNMPRYNGHEIMEKIRQMENLNCLPLIVFSTSQSQDDVQKSYRLGAKSFIQKPLEPSGFKEVAHWLLGYWSRNERVIFSEKS